MNKFKKAHDQPDRVRFLLLSIEVSVNRSLALAHMAEQGRGCAHKAETESNGIECPFRTARAKLAIESSRHATDASQLHREFRLGSFPPGLGCEASAARTIGQRRHPFRGSGP